MPQGCPRDRKTTLIKTMDELKRGPQLADLKAELAANHLCLARGLGAARGLLFGLGQPQSRVGRDVSLTTNLGSLASSSHSRELGSVTGSVCASDSSSVP